MERRYLEDKKFGMQYGCQLSSRKSSESGFDADRDAQYF